MDRQGFGSWGVELSGEDFSRALLALGVLTAAGRGVRPAAADVDQLAEGLEAVLELARARELVPFALDAAMFDEPGRLPPARALLEAWEASPVHAYGVRLEIQGWKAQGRPLDDPLALVGELLRQRPRRHSGDLQDGPGSAYLRDDSPDREVRWDWPLRVGRLQDPPGQQLQVEINRMIADHPWVGPLADFRELDPRGNACDLLLLPGGPRAAAAALLGCPFPVHADCVLVLGDSRGPAVPVLSLLLALRDGANSAGVGWVPVPPGLHGSWFVELLRELSHNQPLDFSLQLASRGTFLHNGGIPDYYEALTAFETTGWRPFLIASRRLVDRTRLSSQIERFIRRYTDPAVRDLRIGVAPAGVGKTQLAPPGPRSLGEVAEHLRLSGSSLPFPHEDDTATSIVRLTKDGEAAVAQAPVPDPEPRWIQAQVYALADGRQAQGVRVFLRDTLHAVDVRIGRREGDWVSPAAGEPPFPADQLPPEQEHQLTVVFWEPRLVPEPQTATALLPRRGNSTSCRYYLRTRVATTHVAARIIVVHRGRVLQTALLRGAAKKAAGRPRSAETLALDIEAVPRPGLRDLDGRRVFDAALVLGWEVDEGVGILGLADRSASFNSPPDLAAETRWFDDQFTKIANDPEAYSRGLEDPKTLRLFRELAKHGSLLHEAVVRRNALGGAITGSKRLQVIAASPEARVPIEFIYDRPPPRPDAPFCPHTAQALETGACAAACPVADPGSVICPLAFWGLSKVIERHACAGPQTGSAPPRDFTLQAEPVSGREALHALGRALIGASNRVDAALPRTKNRSKGPPRGVAQLVAEVQVATGQQPDVIKTWADWVAEVKTGSPSLLVLLVHTDYGEDNTSLQRLEIGSKDYLEVVYLEADHVRNPKQNPPPLVLLIGCETGAPRIAFHSVVARLRDRGAAVVVSSGSAVLGRHTVPITVELVRALAGLRTGDVSFGDVMLLVRRTLVARFPMVLCLSAYGDADWRLAPAPAAGPAGPPPPPPPRRRHKTR
jgi:hypothetical protein